MFNYRIYNMTYKLLLVESPHKAETIGKMLGSEYKVIASVGHIMDLDPKTMSVDIEHDFEPIYIKNPDKIEVIAKIKAAAKNASIIYLCSDLDREGEQISNELVTILNIKDPVRVTYNSITKDEITKALKNPRGLDYKLIDAQKARRVLDRLVGYEISPIVMRVLSVMHLSAGRVQSVVARLIVDREREIQEYLKNEIPAIFKFNGSFKCHDEILNSVLYNIVNNDKGKEEEIEETNDEDENDVAEKGITKIGTVKKANDLMVKLTKSKFSIGKIDEKMLTRNPSPPFSTASMQQAAANKMGMTVKRTMNAAQNLYEAGYITYLRTDSVNLSDEALEMIEKYVKKHYGNEYYLKTEYKTKSKHTQEAHEAIRPTDIKNVDKLEGKKIGTDEIKLYSLIWKRAVASQMTPAKIKQIKIRIRMDNLKDYEFISVNEIVDFQGFLKVYNLENVETDENNIKTLKYIPTQKDTVNIEEIVGKQTYQKPPSRYNDGSLVHKLDVLGICRPATTANFITKIQERNYVTKGDVEGIEKDMITFTINNNNILTKVEGKTMIGKDTNKFIPTELGIYVNDFLMEYFQNVMDYQFTANMEDKLDDIADGKVKWVKVMKDFYKDFHPIVEKIKAKAKELIKKNIRILGKYPNTENDIFTAFARFGPVVRMKKNKKFISAPIRLPLTIKNITLEDAIKLFEYPKLLGQYKNIDVLLQRSKFGYYIVYGTEKISVGENKDIELDDAIEEIEKRASKNLWSETEGKITYKILDGKFGKYINVTGKMKKAMNIKLPKDLGIIDITLDKVKEIVATWKPKRIFKKKTAK